uniref:Ribosomal protein L16 n=1 Tax=Mitrastemon kanehirai TaxID=1358725 RepID=A0A4Y1MD83_9ERIC|nr:ribosomal protein L16 [Mitrastemon kanehirai]
MKNKPKKVKFNKIHRGRISGISKKGTNICFGKYALQAMEPAYITYRQIEAGRQTLIKNIRREGKVWIRIFPNKPITKKPRETRMGSGKGPIQDWIFVIKPGKIIYEIGRVNEKIAKKAITLALYKIPIKTKIKIL